MAALMLRILLLCAVGLLLGLLLRTVTRLSIAASLLIAAVFVLAFAVLLEPDEPPPATHALPPAVPADPLR